jgi:hypothetical protein
MNKTKESIKRIEDQQDYICSQIDKLINFVDELQKSLRECESSLLNTKEVLYKKDKVIWAILDYLEVDIYDACYVTPDARVVDRPILAKSQKDFRGKFVTKEDQDKIVHKVVKELEKMKSNRSK